MYAENDRPLLRETWCPATNGISIEFKICLIDHNEISHSSRQLRCRDVCKISLWSAEYVMNKNITIFIQFRIR